MKNNQKDERKIKPVSFNMTNRGDCELLAYAESSGGTFGAYIKDLIKQDMTKNDVVSALNNIAKILESRSFKVVEDQQLNKPKDSEKVNDEEGKAIVSNLLNMGGKK